MPAKRRISDVAADGPEKDPVQRTKSRISSPEPFFPSTSAPPQTLPYPSTSQPAARTVPFQQPLPLLTFSYTPAHELEFTDSGMRYYRDPPRGADLGHAYERWVRRGEEKGRVDSLLRAYAKARRENTAGMAGVEVGVVCWRGVMTKILTAPYEERDGWELNVMLVDGVLYLEEHVSDARLQEKNDMPAHQRRQMYYGYAFESWCTASSPSSPPRWGGDVDTNVQWCSVVKTKIGSTRLVIGGEVDCVRGRYSGKNDTMVELKTSMNIRGAQDEARFEKKLLKFYFQSFLLGVPEIVVGFRTPKGQLTTVQSFKTMQLPRMIRGKPGAWDAQVCLQWGDEFLSWARRSAGARPGGDAETAGSARARVWRVRFTPRTGVDMALLDGAGVDEVEAGEDRVGFLPRWYWEELLGNGAAGAGGADRAREGPVGARNGGVAHEAGTSSSVVPSGWCI